LLLTKKSISKIKKPKKMKSKKIHVLLIPIFLFANISFLLVPFARSTTLPNGAVYSWSETIYSIDQVTIWDEEPQIMEYDGSYSYTNTHSYSYDYNSTHYCEITSIGEYFSEYDSYTNMSITGNMSQQMDLNVYRVDVSYDNNSDGITDLQLIWMAIKDATWYFDYWITDEAQTYNLKGNNYHNCTIITKIRNKTDNTVDFTSIDYDEGWDNYSFVYDYSSYSLGIIQHISFSINFTIPTILTMQIYATETGDMVAWADMFYNYIVYDDKDYDGIYSAGEGSASNLYNMFTSDEFVGIMMPAAIEEVGTIQTININNPAASPPAYNFEMHFPSDKTISEIASQIIFNPPMAGSGNEISWSIEYPEYPTYAMIMNTSYNYMHLSASPYLYMSSFDGIYAKSSPGNYSYGFNYNINPNKADLDFTIGLSKISNNTFYNATQGFGLSLPHYTYFMGSKAINSGVNNIISKPENLQNFIMGSLSIAEINMIKPMKKNYTLYDYPTIGVDSSYESIGATVSKVTTSGDEQNFGPMSGSDPFMSVVFSLEDIIAGDPRFVNFESYYTVTTQNYPTWSGNKLVHDPTFTAYYGLASRASRGEEIINGFLFIPLIATSAITIVILARTFRKKRRLKQ